VRNARREDGVAGRDGAPADWDQTSSITRQW